MTFNLSVVGRTVCCKNDSPNPVEIWEDQGELLLGVVSPGEEATIEVGRDFPFTIVVHGTVPIDHKAIAAARDRSILEHKARERLESIARKCSANKTILAPSGRHLTRDSRRSVQKEIRS